MLCFDPDSKPTAKPGGSRNETGFSQSSAQFLSSAHHARDAMVQVDGRNDCSCTDPAECRCERANRTFGARRASGGGHATSPATFPGCARSLGKQNEPHPGSRLV